jgi:SIT4-associating protein SAP185/190
VIYDLLQQILNGRLSPGLNRELVIEIIKEARIVERILDAQRANDSLVSQARTPRMPYMGHVILIAEELVKFFARCPQDLWEVIQDSFVPSEWEAFVDGSLRETKDRDARPLAGGKPMAPAPGTEGAADDSDDDDDEIGVHKFGEPLTRTMAQDGYARGGEGYEAYEDRNESGDDDDSVSHPSATVTDFSTGEE